MKTIVVAAGVGFALIGGGLMIYGWLLWPREASFAYLFGYMCALTVALGALFLLLIGNGANTEWFVPIRRPCEAVVGILPLLAVLFVPIIVSIHHLYPWTHPEDLARVTREHVEKKSPLFDHVAIGVRAAIVWAIFLALGEISLFWSARQDSERPDVYRRRLVNLGAGGLPILALATTMGAFDWIMPIEPSWYSDMYGVYVFAGGFVSALGLFGFLTVTWRKRGILPEGVGVEHYHAIGRLQLAMIIFWTYIGWCQLMLYWVADIPLETSWYISRWTGGWQWCGFVLLIAHWGIPFFVLLSRPVKRHAASFLAISLWIVAVHVIDVFYLIAPAAHPKDFHVNLLDVSAVLAVLGACVAFGTWRAGFTSGAPARDPLFEEGLQYEHS